MEQQLSSSAPVPRAHSGYRQLKSYQSARIVYDATVIFCDRFVERTSRTRDQMIQAARSGVQNIAEGSVASASSVETEFRLTSVARASLEELVLDYHDYLRQRGLPIWERDSMHALEARNRFRSPGFDPAASDPHDIGHATDMVAANTLICLINQASFLLGRQLKAIEERLVQHGDVSERLRLERLKKTVPRWTDGWQAGSRKS